MRRKARLDCREDVRPDAPSRRRTRRISRSAPGRSPETCSPADRARPRTRRDRTEAPRRWRASRESRPLGHAPAVHVRAERLPVRRRECRRRHPGFARLRRIRTRSSSSTAHGNVTAGTERLAQIRRGARELPPLPIVGHAGGWPRQAEPTDLSTRMRMSPATSPRANCGASSTAKSCPC